MNEGVVLPKSKSVDYGLSLQSIDDEKVVFDTSALSSAKRNRSFDSVNIAEVQQFWDQRPCNVRHSSEEIGTVKYFEEVEKRKYTVEPHIPSFAEFHKWKGKKVLEIGCGLGTEAVNFAKAGADVTMCDLSSTSIQLCRRRFEVFGLTGTFFVGNAEEMAEFLPKGKKYDLIWSFGAIHHTPHPEKVIDQVRKLLAEDGELRIMIYSKVSWKLIFLMRESGLWDFSKIDQLTTEFAEAQVGCPVAYTYTFDEVRNNLLPGWNILELRKDHIFPYKIPEYKQGLYIKEDCWKNVSPATFSMLEKELGWHTLVRAKLPQTNSFTEEDQQTSQLRKTLP